MMVRPGQERTSHYSPAFRQDAGSIPATAVHQPVKAVLHSSTTESFQFPVRAHTLLNTHLLAWVVVTPVPVFLACSVCRQEKKKTFTGFTQ